MIGFIGLSSPNFESHFTPCIEIEWRLNSGFWRKGYATEGAKEVLKYAFEILNIKKIVSFTVPENIRSISVMKKIGMIKDENGDFHHPKLSLDHKLSKHVLYKIKA